MHPVARTHWHQLPNKHSPEGILLAYTVVKGEEYSHRNSVVGLIGLLGSLKPRDYPSLVALGSVQVCSGRIACSVYHRHKLCP